MKTFKDLKFEPHSIRSGTHAILDFSNGYGVSVCCGRFCSSNGINTYEVAILEGEYICYDTEITDDVLGHLTKDEVTEVMIEVQKLPKREVKNENYQ